MTDKRTPTALIILDGYGYREEKDSNAILAAKTPVMGPSVEREPSQLRFRLRNGRWPARRPDG